MSDPHPTIANWTDPAFLAEAETWIRSCVDVVGPIEQTHVQVWSTVLRVPTSSGLAWFKAPEGHAEGRLTALLVRRVPDRVPELLAVDEERGWMLIRDAGERLREILDRTRDLGRWEGVLRSYAELQLALATDVHELLALGVPDRRLGGIPAAIAALLDRDEYLLLDDPEGITPGQRDELRRRLPAIRTICDELTASGIPESIQHDDLNDGNVYVGPRGSRVMDWGDACISFPFHSLTVVLRATAYRLGLDPGGPELLRMRDAYLEPFARYGSADELRRWAGLAYRSGTLARVLAWQSYVDARDPADRMPDLEAVPYGLRKFLEDGPIGDWR